jgi:hypothetical protein
MMCVISIGRLMLASFLVFNCGNVLRLAWSSDVINYYHKTMYCFFPDILVSVNTASNYLVNYLVFSHKERLDLCEMRPSRLVGPL